MTLWSQVRVTKTSFAGVLAAGLVFAAGVMTLREAAAWSLHGAFPESTLVTDRAGNVLRLTTASDGQYRLWTAVNEFPPETLDAVLTKEDRSFWINPGVDPPALARAAWHTFVARDYRLGASTVSMQTVRLAWNLDTSQVTGKLMQIAGALVLAALVPKTDILEAYLNLAPCGGNVQGLGTASRIWFGKPPARLNLSESLALAGLPQDPSHRNPGGSDSGAAIETARQLLAAQWLKRYPGASESLKAQLAMPLAFTRHLPFLAPHLVTRLLGEHPGAHRLHTTIDSSLQRLAENAVSRFTRRNGSLGVTNAAAMIVKADTMEVLASVGSADFHDESIQGQVDGTRALRSPGSTLKPFLYALALQQGLIHPLSTLKDARVHFGGYNPDNFDNDFEGPIRAVDALVKSRNVPAVILTGQVKHPDLYEFLQNADMDLPYPREHYGLSLILGGAEVSMAGLVRLYGSLAGPGNQAGVTRSLRELADEPPAPTQRLLTAESAWLVRKMLETKPRPDVGDWNASPVLADSAAELARNIPDSTEWGDRPDAVAYKTGTSIGFRDAWSVGIADGYIVAVWVGDFAGASNPEYIGLKTAAPLMFEIIDAWRAGTSRPAPPEDRPPSGIVFVPVCSVSGGIATDACPDVVLAPFIAGVSPIATCAVHQIFPVDRITGLRRAHPIPGVTKPVRYEVWPSDILQLFTDAGLARAVPPALDPDDSALPATGQPPQILSPTRGLGYRSDQAGERIPLAAAVSSDSRSVWWFIDDKVVGQAPSGEPLLWKPVAGHHEVRAVDDAGRQTKLSFDVLP